MIAVAAVAAGLLVGRIPSTEAQWAENREVTAVMAALVVPPPVIESCTTAPGLLGANPRVILVWRYPTSITPSGVEAYAAVGGLLPVLLSPLLSNVVTVAGPGGQFTTTFSLGLLTGLLGGTFTVGLATQYQGWVSTPVARSATFDGLGFASDCRLPG